MATQGELLSSWQYQKQKLKHTAYCTVEISCWQILHKQKCSKWNWNLLLLRLLLRKPSWAVMMLMIWGHVTKGMVVVTCS